MSNPKRNDDSTYLIIGLIFILIVFFLLNSLPVIGSVINLAIALLMWGIIGYFAGRIIRGAGFGTLGNILLGIMGGIVGSIVVRLFGLGGLFGIPIFGTFIVGVIGAVVFIFVMRLIDSNFAR